MSRRASFGATEEPDVVDEELRAWEPEALEAGFEIEDARLGEAVDLSDLAASGGKIARSRLEGVRLAGSRLRSLRLVDVVVGDADVSNADWTGAQLTRVGFLRCRMTGFGGASIHAEHVTLRECKLDLANLRRATLRRVTFEDCVLDDADLGGASLRETRFSHSRLLRVLIDDVRLEAVDLRGSQLDLVGDVVGLRGAIVDSIQLVELGPRLAHGLGIDVRDDDPA
jgi:fluoroquinolone resistance protein